MDPIRRQSVTALKLYFLTFKKRFEKKVLIVKNRYFRKIYRRKVRMNPIPR